jgi:isorenieratene synthase
VRFRTAQGLRTFHASHVILAADPQGTKHILLNSAFARPTAEKMTWPEGVANAIVRLWFDTQPKPGPEGGILTGDFVIDNYFWLDRIHTDFGAWARETGGSAMEMHLYRMDAFFQQPDAVILAQCIQDVYRAWPEMRGHLKAQLLQRNSAVHTRLTIDKADKWLGVETPWPNLFACGDWVRGAWPALFLERACVSGVEAANRVLQAEGLELFPIAAYSEPEWLAARIRKWMLDEREKVRRRKLGG